jgi:flagellar biosynthesis/type III secretory pathway M-ring protein FliF/YscJ
MTFGFYLAILVVLGVIFGAVVWPRILKQKKDREERKKAAVEVQAKIDAERKSMGEYPPIMRGRSMSEKEIHARITGTKFFGL